MINLWKWPSENKHYCIMFIAPGSGSGRRYGFGPPTKVPVPAELRPTDSPALGITGRSKSSDDLMGSADDSIQQMDYEEDEGLYRIEENGRGTVLKSSLDSPAVLMPREDGDFNEDFSSHGLQQTQDTGYHTNSLQSTNQDPLGPPSNNVTCYDTLGQMHQQHTNLTAQFSSMPFCSHGDTGVEFELTTDLTGGHSQGQVGEEENSAMFVTSDPSSQPLTTTSSIPRKVTSLITPASSASFMFAKAGTVSSSSAHSGGRDVLVESTEMTDQEVLHRARQALGKAVSRSAESPLQPSQGLKPRLINTMGVPVFPWQAGTEKPGEGGSGVAATRPAVFKEKITGQESGQDNLLPASK